MHQLARRRAQRTLAHVRPQALEIGEIRAQAIGIDAVGRRAHDVTAGVTVADHLLHDFAQARAFGFVLDARRDADAVPARHEHQIARRQRNEGGQARAFTAHRIFDHLHHDVVAAAHQTTDVLAAFALVRRRTRRTAGCSGGGDALRIEPHVRRDDVVDVQKRRAREPDLDEGRLHAGQHPLHAPFVDVADESATTLALDEYFLQHAPLEQRGTYFARGDVDENFGAHEVRACHSGTPAAIKSPAVSCSGNPITPE